MAAAEEPIAEKPAPQPIAYIELPCFECDSITPWYQYSPGGIYHCRNQFPDIAQGRSRPTEYANMFIREYGREDFHRIAWWAGVGYVLFFPYNHEDCERCEDSYMPTIHEHGFHCHCGRISPDTAEFGPDLHRWLIARMFGCLLDGWFDPAEWVNFPESLDFVLWYEARKVATLCFLRLGLSADLSRHIMKFTRVPLTVNLAAAIDEEREAGMIE